MVVGAGARATLGIVRGGTVSGANGGVERSETASGTDHHRTDSVNKKKAPGEGALKG